MPLVVSQLSINRLIVTGLAELAKRRKPSLLSRSFGMFTGTRRGDFFIVIPLTEAVVPREINNSRYVVLKPQISFDPDEFKRLLNKHTRSAFRAHHVKEADFYGDGKDFLVVPVWVP